MEPGLTATVRLTVGATDTAIAIGSGDVPVLGTPRVVALCEEATVAAVAGQLGRGTTTVATRVECDHSKPSWPGETVTARATLVNVDGRHLQFTVAVVDVNTEEVASARVWRVVVERERFLDH